jgi:diketogulonate reductase-like aldo/keto reductase
MVNPSNNFAVLPKSATTSRIASNIQIAQLLGVLSDKDISDINELADENMPIEWKAHGFP